MTKPHAPAVQEALFPAPPVPLPDLREYDLIIVSISGGKDSMAALAETVRHARKAEVPDRVITVFCDLGPDDEWPGTKELAAEHAAFYGLRHEVVYRTVPGPDGEPVPQTLGEHIEQRGKWPDAANRYCTSDMKRAPVYKLMTRLAAECRAGGVTGRPVRFLNVLGMRAQESPKRAAMVPFCRDERASNKTVRHVDEWLPVHDWDVARVWAGIAGSGMRAHWVYRYLPRLSCRFCVLASLTALINAVHLDAEGARKIAEREARMGHDFKHKMPMREIIRLAGQMPAPPPADDWVA